MAHSPYNVSEEVIFKLMKRERSSLLPIPVEESNQVPVSGLLSLRETSIDTTYSKLLLAKPEDVMSIIQTERMELKNQLTENEGCPEVCFIEQALELLKEREEGIKKTLKETNTECQLSKKEMKSLTDNDLSSEFNSTLLLCDEGKADRNRSESLSSETGTISEDDHPNVAAEDLEITNYVTSKPFYFYQGL